MSTLAFLQPTTWQIVLILVVGLLLFGKRLPEIGKGLGRGIVEFRKGLKGIEDEIDTESSKPAASTQRLEQQPVYRAPVTDGADPRVSQTPAAPAADAPRP